MAEYYDSETLKKALGEAYNKLSVYPAADVAPVRRGRWVPVGMDDVDEGMFKCSECGNENFFPELLMGISADNYCSNCGADMREETELKKSKKHDKAVKDAYNLLVAYRKSVEDRDPEYAEIIENAYKQLWCECINERAPWVSKGGY